MRFHQTIGFSHVCNAAEDARRDFCRMIVNDPQDPYWLNKHISASMEMFLYPATTPSEVRVKLLALNEHGAAHWLRSRPDDIFEALVKDVQRLSTDLASPPIVRALEFLFEIRVSSFKSTDDADDDAWHRRENHALRSLLSTPCTTPGDFIAKTYVDMLGEMGSTMYGAFEEDGTGNHFDIDIDKADSPLDHHEAWQRAAYADIDACDLGANLLAYGLPEFSAPKWIERARAVGLKVWLIDDFTGGFFGTSFDEEEELSDRISRERDRLRRLLAFAKNRSVEVADEIRRNWPDLMLPRAGAIGAGA